MESNRLLRELYGHIGAVNAVRFTNNGNYVMTCSDDKSILLFNPHRDDPKQPGQALLIKTYSGSHSYPIYDLAISHDNSRFVAAGGDRNIFYYDVATGNVIRRISGHTQKINAVALNMDSNVVLTASDDKTLKAWDLRSNVKDPIQTFDQFKDSVTCIDQTSSAIATGSVDGCIRIYDLRVGQLHSDNVSDPITSIAYSSNKKSILAMCLGGYNRLVDVESGRLVQEYSGNHVHTSFKSEAIFSNDNNLIICGSENSAIVMYNFLSGELQAKITVTPSTVLRSISSVYGNKDKDVVITSLATHSKLPLLLSAATDGVVRCYEILT